MTGNRRVKVTSPQTRIALARGYRPRPRPLPLPGPADPERARTVFAAQRRTALRTIALLGLVLFGTSGVIAAFPALDRVALGDFPVSWLLLAIATYPLLLVIAIAHVRTAERTETAAESEPEPDEDLAGDPFGPAGGTAGRPDGDHGLLRNGPGYPGGPA